MIVNNLQKRDRERAPERRALLGPKIVARPNGRTMLGALLVLLALVLLGGFSARAQSNSIPGDGDYEKFSAFISARNIFDPTRYPHYTPHHTTRPHHVSASAPMFTLVGTMSYEKGIFAFFSGNSEDLKKVLSMSGNIAGYNVTEITSSGVKMTGADKKEIVLKIGDRMQQGNSGWQLLDPSEESSASPVSQNPAAGNGSGTAATADSSAAAPAPNLGGNSVLERLRKLKEQEK